MNKNHKMLIAVMFIVGSSIGMLILSQDYMRDKPLIDAQRQQAVSQVNLTPDQMVNGIKQFINDTSSNLNRPMP